MKIIYPFITLLTDVSGSQVLKQIEEIARICFKSGDRITDESSEPFVRMLLENEHDAMIEHGPNISVHFVCDRGVSHEIVRHRLFSFAQESTRYCNYAKNDEIVVIRPSFWYAQPSYDEWYSVKAEHPARLLPGKERLYTEWLSAMTLAEGAYMDLINEGATPQEARSVLPHSLKTEIVVTGNVREWRHFFRLRTAKNAHPQMQEVAKLALVRLYAEMPVIFEDIFEFVFGTGKEPLEVWRWLTCTYNY